MKKTELSHATVVDFIADILLRRGAESYLGEAVTMSEHMLQCAQLAENESGNDELIAAALLHDIGHYTNEFPEDAQDQGIDNHHEAAGAAILARFFPQRVVDCVRQHVAAKRYLCATVPEYFGKLSEASVTTLKLQGGPMNEHECDEFATQPFLDDIIKVRYWDEAGKQHNVTTPNFAHYAPVLQRLVTATR